MVITDRIYGKTTITSPVLIELIASRPMQRLKGIAQYGIPDAFYHKKGFSRYEHSVGVMLLLKKLGASEEEQIAGLLHDVSHTAFPHIIDWVVSEGNTEDFQDEQHNTYISQSEIPGILKKYNYLVEKITDYPPFQPAGTRLARPLRRQNRLFTPRLSGYHRPGLLGGPHRYE